MLNVSQPVAVYPLAAPIIAENMSAAETAVLAAKTGGAPAQKQKVASILMIVDSLAIISVSGTIIARKTPCMKDFPYLFEVAACDEIAAALNEAANDPRVEAICLDFDSPGGQVTGVPEIAGMIRALRDRLPIVAFTATMCCSAAYWMASQASAVFSAPSATVGSIGVFMAFLDKSRRLEKEGYKVELFSTGAYKGAGVTGSLTDAQRSQFQRDVEAIFEDFKAALSERGIPAEAMEGQTFYGHAAADARLVDGFALSPVGALTKYLSTCKKV